MKAAILYLPVIHAGHLDFSQRQRPDSLFVLGESLISELPYLERDIRRISPGLAAKQAAAVNLAPNISVLEKPDIPELDSFGEIVIADDDVGRMLEEKYLQGKRVVKDSAFLRWHNMNAVTQTPPEDNATITSEELHKEFINLAQKEADKSSDWWRHVGALLIQDGNIVLAGYNKHFPTEHSAYIEGDPRSGFNAGPQIADIVTSQHGEASIISEAAKRGISTEGMSMYVTTFPCPMCAMLISKSGIKKVYYRDGYSLLDAEKILKQAGVELIKVV